MSSVLCCSALVLGCGQSTPVPPSAPPQSAQGARPEPASPVLAASDAPRRALPKREPASAPAPRCTLLLGGTDSALWFDAGFSARLAEPRWEALLAPGSSLEDWADPGSPVWSGRLRSACSERSDAPERVVLFVMNARYKTESEWITGLVASVNAIRARYPSARRIELAPPPELPRDPACSAPANRRIAEQAIDKVSAKLEGLVLRGPRLTVQSCSWLDARLELSESGRRALAEQAAEYFAAEL